MRAEIPPGQVYSTLDVKPSDLKAVQEGMRQVIEGDGGTGQRAQVPGYVLAGKTGTAQAYVRMDGGVKQDLKTWFYCYGPFEAPRYVCCVLVEGGTWGGTTSAPIAQEIMRRLFALDTGGVENVAYLQPAQGNFNGVTEVEVHTDATTPADNPDNPDNPSSTPMPDLPPGGYSAASTKHAH
jgi:membrane peptidoglycan carboxypeptidase